jgi:hypothetical protein
MGIVIFWLMIVALICANIFAFGYDRGMRDGANAQVNGTKRAILWRKALIRAQARKDIAEMEKINGK